jgi:hypothetical protein
MGVSMRRIALWLATLSLGLAFSVAGLSAQVGRSNVSPNGASQVSTDQSTASSPSSGVGTDDQPSTDKSQKESETPADKGKLRLHLGTIWVGASYSHFSGPYYYPYGPYGFYPGDWVYGSLWYPMWGPYPYYSADYFNYQSGRGELKLSADPKLAEVYIDGAYAGTADRLKSIWLDPGAYDLTVSAADRESFHQRVYVLSGKSLKITAKLGSETTKEKL